MFADLNTYTVMPVEYSHLNSQGDRGERSNTIELQFANTDGQQKLLPGLPISGVAKKKGLKFVFDVFGVRLVSLLPFPAIALR